VDWAGQIGPPFSSYVQMVFFPAVMILLHSAEKCSVLHSTRLGGELESGEFFGASSLEVSNSVGVAVRDLGVFLAVHSD
jgi:hypothetical protein